MEVQLQAKDAAHAQRMKQTGLEFQMLQKALNNMKKKKEAAENQAASLYEQSFKTEARHAEEMAAAAGVHAVEMACLREQLAADKLQTDSLSPKSMLEIQHDLLVEERAVAVEQEEAEVVEAVQSEEGRQEEQSGSCVLCGGELLQAFGQSLDYVSEAILPVPHSLMLSQSDGGCDTFEPLANIMESVVLLRARGQSDGGCPEAAAAVPPPHAMAHMRREVKGARSRRSKAERESGGLIRQLLQLGAMPVAKQTSAASSPGTDELGNERLMTHQSRTHCRELNSLLQAMLLGFTFTRT